jgi:hypothetical protein
MTRTIKMLGTGEVVEASRLDADALVQLGRAIRVSGVVEQPPKPAPKPIQEPLKTLGEQAPKDSQPADDKPRITRHKRT